MEFMNLFTGKKTQETISTQNGTIKTCHADKPNEECSSIDKIRKLQDEIESLQKKKRGLNCESAYSVIFDINISDKNIINRCRNSCINIHNYNSKKEIENRWFDFISLFNFIEDKSKDRIINYLKNQKNTKQIIANYNSRINDLENQIQLEKQKLGIK